MSGQVTLRLEPLGRKLKVTRGAPLRLALQECGVEFPCGGRGRCGRCRIRQVAGFLDGGGDQGEILSARELAQGWRLACRCTVECDVTLEVGQWETVILGDHSVFDFEPRAGLGIAVDLGTTTIVAQLIDLESGRVLAVATAVNPHAAYGADVMTRIDLALAGSRVAMTDQLREAVGGLCSRLYDPQSPEARVSLTRVVIAGNTVMHHLFCGIDPGPLAEAPFEPREGDLRSFRADELGWRFGSNPVVSFLPCIGGFVGSDVLCGIAATGMARRSSLAVLIDMGTNGEIVVGNSERMLCTSTAAGPAFEGGRIGMGMRATTGAISEVVVDKGRIRVRVIGNALARGICGSGLVDAVAAGLELGLIDPSGRLVDGTPLRLAPGVELTQHDVRQLQLAKGAIAAGVRTLSGRFGSEACRSTTYMAGAFGNYVNHDAARRIGLIDASETLIESIGNSALLGAKMALFDIDSGLEAFDVLRSRIEYVPLAADLAFHRSYLSELGFPDRRLEQGPWP